jgi:hypothetical protein
MFNLFKRVFTVVLLLLVPPIRAGHSYISNIASANPAAECGATPACISHRECTFGTTKTYDVVRQTLFEATGYSLACINQCNCTRNPVNPVQTMTDRAVADPTLWSNNVICNNAAIHAAMIYITANFECESVFAEAQVPLFGLCGYINDSPCRGHCSTQFDINTALPACETRKGVDNVEWGTIIVLSILGLIIWTSADTNYIAITPTDEHSPLIPKPKTSALDDIL